MFVAPKKHKKDYTAYRLYMRPKKYFVSSPFPILSVLVLRSNQKGMYYIFCNKRIGIFFLKEVPL